MKCVVIESHRLEGGVVRAPSSSPIGWPARTFHLNHSPSRPDSHACDPEKILIQTLCDGRSMSKSSLTSDEPSPYPTVGPSEESHDNHSRQWPQIKAAVAAAGSGADDVASISASDRNTIFHNLDDDIHSPVSSAGGPRDGSVVAQEGRKERTPPLSSQQDEGNVLPLLVGIDNGFEDASRIRTTNMQTPNMTAPQTLATDESTNLGQGGMNAEAASSSSEAVTLDQRHEPALSETEVSSIKIEPDAPNPIDSPASSDSLQHKSSTTASLASSNSESTSVQRIETTTEPLKHAPPEQETAASPTHHKELGKGTMDHEQRPTASPVQGPVQEPEVASDFQRRQCRAVETRNQSSSRGQVEKMIEAKMSDVDSASNARSRKASHILGIFKENEAPIEHKRVQSTPRRSSALVEAVPVLSEDSVEQDHSGVTPCRPSRAKTESAAASNLFHSSLATKKESKSIRGTSDTTLDCLSMKADASAHHTLPLRLLEEIRNFHNIAPSYHQKFKSGHPLHDVDSDRAKRGSQETTSQNQVSAKTGVELVSKAMTESALHDGHEDEEGSEREHITSALYYPRQALLPSAFEDTSADDQEYHEDSGRQEETETEGTSPPSDNEGGIEDMDITLKLEDQSRHLHGDLQKVKAVVNETVQTKHMQPVLGSTSSTSGSDYDYSSLTEDSETTPTATPNQKSTTQQTKPSKKHRPAPSPLGAVELKPYNHQVGGHTTVFRFSKRAICKKLSNRENEFYEVVERLHPELLKFLPRYIGVLNVTYRKATKRKRLESTGEAAAKPVMESERGTAAVVDGIVGPVDEPNMHLPPSTPPNFERLVSHSQHTGTVPQVVLANNRHIIPENMFLRPTTETSTDGPQISDKQSSDGASPGLRGSGDNQSLERASPMLSSTLKHHFSRGSTTINTKLKEQVLREVFGPPVIHRHHRNARNHATIPRIKEVADQGGDGPERTLLNQRKSIDFVNLPKAKEEGDHKYLLGKLSPRRQATVHPLSTLQAANPDDLNRSKTSESNGVTLTVPSKQVRRRHSGSGLHSRQIQIDSKERSNFEYYEDDGYRGDYEDEIFAMDMDSLKPKNSPMKTSSEHSSSTHTESTNLPVRQLGSVSAFHEIHPNSSNTLQIQSPRPSAEPSMGDSATDPALTQSSDRVQQFLLLEDLTSGMNKPCVLDLKMGTRQYGIDADAKKKQSQRCKCMVTTSQQLGVRLCGMQVWNKAEQNYLYKDKYWGRELKAGEEFQDAFKRFFYDGRSYQWAASLIPTILEKIQKLEKIICGLPGFRFYASSLLFLYEGDQEAVAAASTTDAEGKTKLTPTLDVRIVDFANSVTAEDQLPESTPCPPHDPHGIDRGYLRGLQSLRQYLNGILWEVQHHGGPDTSAFLHGDTFDQDDKDQEDLGNVSI